MPPTLGRVFGDLQRPLQGPLGSPAVQCAAEPGARFRSAVPRCGSVETRGRNIKTADKVRVHILYTRYKTAANQEER